MSTSASIWPGQKRCATIRGMTGDSQNHEDQSPDSAQSVQMVPQHVWEFVNEAESLSRVADQMQGYLYELSTDALIPVHTIDARAKSLKSYMEKCERKDSRGRRKYSDPRSQIDDCVAARIIVYTTRARQDFLDLLKTRLVTRDHQNPGESKRNGYDSDHLVVTGVDGGDLSSAYADLSNFLRQGRGLEVQIRTVAGHAWAEYEHDVRYKSSAYRDLDGNARNFVDQRFIEAGGLRRYLDNIFNEIDQYLVPNVLAADEAAEDDGPFADGDSPDDGDGTPLSIESLKGLLGSRYPEVEVGEENALHDLIRHVESLGIRTTSAIESALERVDSEDVATLMDYPSEVSGVRLLDDELLAVLTRRYVDAAQDETRKQLLELRLRRVFGKFAIYVIEEDGEKIAGPIAGARAVRVLAGLVAERLGPEAAVIEGAVGLEEEDLNKSTTPRFVEASESGVYVASNLARSYAEWLMRELHERLPDDSVRVFRAGDQLLPSASS